MALTPRPTKASSSKPGPARTRFTTTRAAHRDETSEDYVEAIQQLSASNADPHADGDGRGARVKDLAVMMGVSHVTVVRIVSRLARCGLVTTSRGQPVQLTPAGKRLAHKARVRHEIVLGFLLSLGVPKRQAEIDSEGIEHHVSEATLKAMQRATKS